MTTDDSSQKPEDTDEASPANEGDQAGHPETTESAEPATPGDDAEASDAEASDADGPPSAEASDADEPPSAEDPEGQDSDAELACILEALIFAAPRPAPIEHLKRLTGASMQRLRAALDELRDRYQGGVQLTDVSGGYQFRTNPRLAHWIRKLLSGRPQRLTRPMLETLAIIAYRQPITRPEIEEIRGVDCGGTLRVLLERNLVRILGKKEEIGRPLLYGTSKYFLEFFQLRDLKAMPTLRQFAELSEEHRDQIDRQFGRPASVVDEANEAVPPLEPPVDSATEIEPEEAPSAPHLEVTPPEVTQQRNAEDEACFEALDRALSTADAVLKTEKQPTPPEAEPATPIEETPPAGAAAEDDASGVL